MGRYVHDAHIFAGVDIAGVGVVLVTALLAADSSTSQNATTSQPASV